MDISQQGKDKLRQNVLIQILVRAMEMIVPTHYRHPAYRGYRRYRLSEKQNDRQRACFGRHTAATIVWQRRRRRKNGARDPIYNVGERCRADTEHTGNCKRQRHGRCVDDQSQKDRRKGQPFNGYRLLQRRRFNDFIRMDDDNDAGIEVMTDSCASGKRRGDIVISDELAVGARIRPWVKF